MPKNLKWRALLTLALVALALWKLYPPRKTINLGLDLKGGMHLVLQVDLLKYFDNEAVNIDEPFDNYIAAVESKISPTQENLLLVLEDEADNQGIELYKYFPDYLDGKKAKPNKEIIAAFWKEASDAPHKAEEIIRRRVDTFGVAEPVIHTEGKNRIVVQLPGVKERTRAKALIGKTAVMEFRLVSEDREKLKEAMQGKKIPGYEVLSGEAGVFLVKRQPSLTGASL